MATKISADALLQIAKSRRSYYPLTKSLTISKERIQHLVNEATLHTPSSFNTQSNRIVVLFDEEHDKLWGMTTSVLKAIVPEERWKHTGDRMALFKGAAGTIMFFNDADRISESKVKYPFLADKFEEFAAQSNAIQQYLLWNLLELEGLGANLQHYNPIIDAKVAEAWKLPSSWKLNAQLVFGGRGAEVGEKEFEPLEERVKVFGA